MANDSLASLHCSAPFRALKPQSWLFQPPVDAFKWRFHSLPSWRNVWLHTTLSIRIFWEPTRWFPSVITSTKVVDGRQQHRWKEWRWWVTSQWENVIVQTWYLPGPQRPWPWCLAWDRAKQAPLNNERSATVPFCTLNFPFGYYQWNPGAVCLKLALEFRLGHNNLKKQNFNIMIVKHLPS